jgi:hypothetical protein
MNEMDPHGPQLIALEELQEAITSIKSSDLSLIAVVGKLRLSRRGWRPWKEDLR